MPFGFSPGGTEPGRWALPGDLLYLAHDGELGGGGLPRGHYWLAAQTSEREVVLLRARRKGGGAWGFGGEPFAAPRDVLGAMMTTGVSCREDAESGDDPREAQDP